MSHRERKKDACSPVLKGFRDFICGRYMERDPVRGKDSFAAFEEMLLLAKQKKVRLDSGRYTTAAVGLVLVLVGIGVSGSP